MEEKEIVLSYETLFELLRLERSRNDLQVLPIDFDKQVNDLICIEQKKILESIESESAQKKVQLKNMIKILTEIYDRREKKVINLTIEKSRNKSAIIDFSKLLPVERNIFEKVSDILSESRNTFNCSVETSEKMVTEPQKEDVTKETDESSVPESGEYKTVRFISSIPSFVGLNLEEYGPFEAENVAKLPTIIADILINKNRAERIKISQYS